MSSTLIELIKQVLLSWQVIFITIAFFFWCFVLSLAVSPRTMPAAKKTVKIRKLKRPKNKAPEVPADVDAGGLGLGD
ncbi:MAG: hypothetical protein Pg6A_13720 [Termitinemataceae bacterium]|nr:MAG: hypothetical protein Pg6A_13720 [Termitinemataceae bacterium]